VKRRYYDTDLQHLANLLQYHGDEITRSDNTDLLRVVNECQDLRELIDKAYRVTGKSMGESPR
jgi:hypothetical protein